MAVLVFVFGTLKQGFPNYPTNRGTRVPGDFFTEERFPFHLIGERHSPWLVDLPGQGEHVRGQVFEVTPEALEAMDLLERTHEPDGYRRVEIVVRPDANPAAADRSERLRVFAYLKPGASLAGAQIMAGPLSEYSLEHAARYRRRAP